MSNKGEESKKNLKAETTFKVSGEARTAANKQHRRFDVCPTRHYERFQGEYRNAEYAERR